MVSNVFYLFHKNTLSTFFMLKVNASISMSSTATNSVYNFIRYEQTSEISSD